MWKHLFLFVCLGFFRGMVLLSRQELHALCQSEYLEYLAFR